MAETIDARGLACPEPVILAKRAMQQSDEVEVLVDSDISRRSVTSMAAESGWLVRVRENRGEYLISMSKNLPLPENATGPAGTPSASCVLVMDEGLGTGPEELRIALMKAFLHTLTETSPLPREIIFLTNGVKLVSRGSAVIDDLTQLQAAGVRLLACGTCLDYFGLKEQVEVGRISNMYEIAETLLQAGNVVRV
jgi:selenium metabolism protein YedF